MRVTHRERERVTANFRDEPSKTQQSHRDACDINLLVKRWRQGSEEFPEGGRLAYGDFTNADDYLAARNRIIDAQQAFNTLPSRIRARFAHRPEALLAFLADPANEAEARELGLLEEAETAPPVTPAATPPAESEANSPVGGEAP